MKVLIIDGQGGHIGRLIIERLRPALPEAELIAVGTNSIATAAMMKAGADAGATGENPVVVCCRDADVIVGPSGIVVADSLLGEVTPAMAETVGKAAAHKVLIPMNRCNHTVVGVADLPMGELARLAAETVVSLAARR